MDDLARLSAYSDQDADIRRVCQTMVAANGCTSLAHLMDAQPELFDELLELAESMATLDP